MRGRWDRGVIMRKARWVAVIALVLGAVWVGNATASTPQVNACYSVLTGNLRVMVPLRPKCGPLEKAIAWDQQVPPTTSSSTTSTVPTSTAAGTTKIKTAVSAGVPSAPDAQGYQTLPDLTMSVTAPAGGAVLHVTFWSQGAINYAASLWIDGVGVAFQAGGVQTSVLEAAPSVAAGAHTIQVKVSDPPPDGQDLQGPRNVVMRADLLAPGSVAGPVDSGTTGGL